MTEARAVSQLRDIWRLLPMDDRRYLVVRPVFVTDIDAAREIGKEKNWLNGRKQNKKFLKAVEIRAQCSDAEVSDLLDDDMQSLLRVKLAQHVVDGSRDRNKKDTLDLIKTVSSLKRSTALASSGGSKNGSSEDGDDIDWATVGEMPKPMDPMLPRQQSNEEKS